MHDVYLPAQMVEQIALPWNRLTRVYGDGIAGSGGSSATDCAGADRATQLFR